MIKFYENDEAVFRYLADCNSEPSKLLSEIETFTEGRRYQFKMSEAREQKLLEVIEYQSQVLNKIKWLGHTERQDMYPQLTLYVCPTCTSSETAREALAKVDEMLKEIGLGK